MVAKITEPSLEDLLENANALHEQAEAASKGALRNASETLIAAWRAGGELIEAKRIVKKVCGHGDWEAFVKGKFKGSLTTAKRYIRLRKSFTDVADLPNKSLRATYREMGMISETNARPGTTRPSSPGKHIPLSLQLATHVREITGSGDKDRIRWLRRDLHGLHAAMLRLYAISLNQSAPGITS